MAPPGSKREKLKNLLSPHSKPTSPDGGLQPVDSASSIASDPNNYLRDQQLEEDLVVEEMVEREGTIGSGDHREGDGVRPLSTAPPPPVGAIPPLPPAVASGPAPEGNVVIPGAPPPPIGVTPVADPRPPPPVGVPPVANPPPITASAPAASGGGGMYRNVFGGNGGNGGGGRGGKKSSKQKFEERQARKQQALLDSAPPVDEGWTAQLEKERQEEIKVVGEACAVLGREIFEIPPDGHCMYHAIADQLAEIGLIPSHQAASPKAIRAKAADFMLSHPDDFRFFLASVDGEDTAAAKTHEGVMTEKEFKKYCKNVKDTGEWGGEPEIQALSRAYGVPIHVIQRGPPTVVSHGGQDDTFGGASTAEQSRKAGDRVVRISYHRRMYGLGEHYNSLRKMS